jgi:mevalonate pyrophosphate decarboxylase
MDAGPNVKLLCSEGDADAVAQAVSATFDLETVITRSGPGAHRVDGDVR